MKTAPAGFALFNERGRGLTSYFYAKTIFNKGSQPVASFCSTLSGRICLRNATPDIAKEEAKTALLLLSDRLAQFGPPTLALGQYARDRFSSVKIIAVDDRKDAAFSIKDLFSEMVDEYCVQQKGRQTNLSPLLNLKRLERIAEFFPHQI